MLTASTALALALTCAPRVSPDILLSVAYIESRWNPLALRDNVTVAPRLRKRCRIHAKLVLQGAETHGEAHLRLLQEALAQGGCCFDADFLADVSDDVADWLTQAAACAEAAC